VGEYEVDYVVVDVGFGVGDEVFDVSDVLCVVGLLYGFGVVGVDVGVGVGFGEYYCVVLVVVDQVLGEFFLFCGFEVV